MYIKYFRFLKFCIKFELLEYLASRVMQVNSIELDSLLKQIPKAISPCFEGDYFSIIYTQNTTHYSVYTVDELLDYYCMIFGSDLRGRLRATREKLGIYKYPPILVSPFHVGIQFPTICKRGKIWVFSMDFVILSRNKQGSTIKIDNHIEFQVPMSQRTLRNKKAQALEVYYAFTKNSLNIV